MRSFPSYSLLFSVSGKRGEKKSGFAPSFLENDCGGHGCGKDKEEEEERRALFYFFASAFSPKRKGCNLV